MVETIVVRNVKIFIASPGDLASERKAAVDIFGKINRGYLRDKTTKISDIRFEKDTYTQYGNDPQFILNAQIADDFDAILIMFWGRVGSKTPRAISGTIEELQRAERRFRRTGKPHIMCYFKRAGLDPLSLDVEQVRFVQAIYQAMKKKGLVFEFRTMKEFQDKLDSDVVKWLEARRSVRKVVGPRPNLASVRQLRSKRKKN